MSLDLTYLWYPLFFFFGIVCGWAIVEGLSRD